MDSQKLENMLNLSLNLSEEDRADLGTDCKIQWGSGMV